MKTGVYNMHITNEFFCFKGLAAYNTKEMNKTASTLNWIEKNQYTCTFIEMKYYNNNDGDDFFFWAFLTFFFSATTSISEF